ncbi:MAG: alpha-ketoacid dehydrogenase subunit beta [Acidimicrobiia bacterium]|nr:alpha-ketoacid dehydrogenase subunit beta [Acidimicrobiia bacterium]
MTATTIADAIRGALAAELESDSRVMVLGEDVGRNGGVFRITDGLQAKYGPDRVVDTPVAESGIIGTAVGLAIGGMRPVCEMQFMGFSYPAFDQIASHVARMRNRSRHRFTLPMVIRMPFGGGIGAAEHHSESNEALYVNVPGLKIVVPSTPYDAAGLIHSAVADPDPVIILEPIRLYRAVKEEVPDLPFDVPIGVARVERTGSDVTLISYGAMTKEMRWAADHLATEGVSVEVIDIRTLVPLDEATVVASVEKTGRAVVITEAARTGGFASEIIAVIQERALYSLEAPIQRVTGWDTVFPLRRTEEYYLPSVERIVRAARATLEA